MRTVLISFLLSVSAQAASVPNPTLVDQGYRQMYNLDFDAAHRSFDEWQRLHPQDPIRPGVRRGGLPIQRIRPPAHSQSQFFVEDSSFRGMKKPVARSSAQAEIRSGTG